MRETYQIDVPEREGQKKEKDSLCYTHHKCAFQKPAKRDIKEKNRAEG
jgi:hypothetical protein